MARGNFDPEWCPCCGEVVRPKLSADGLVISYDCACGRWWRAVYLRHPTDHIPSTLWIIEAGLLPDDGYWTQGWTV